MQLEEILAEAGYDGELGSHKDKNYKILWELEQRSDLWRTLREGSCGGTGAYNLLKNGWKNAAHEKSTLHHATFSTQWGIDHEDDARDEFVSQPAIKNFLEENNLIGIEAGMVFRTDLQKKCHYSPDWLLVDKDDNNLIKGACEIKCFQEKHHLQIVESKRIDTKILCQMQFGMFMCEIPYCFFIAFNPTLVDEKRLWIKKVEREDKYQDRFLELLNG